MKALQADGELLKQFKYELARASTFCLGMALVTESGLDPLNPSIEEFLARGGHASVLFGVDLPTEPKAIERLCAIQTQYRSKFDLRAFNREEWPSMRSSRSFIGRLA
jgi:hypothetical protein